MDTKTGDLAYAMDEGDTAASSPEVLDCQADEAFSSEILGCLLPD